MGVVFRVTHIPGEDGPGFMLKPVTRHVIRPSVTCHWLCVIAGAGPEQLSAVRRESNPGDPGIQILRIVKSVGRGPAYDCQLRSLQLQLVLKGSS